MARVVVYLRFARSRNGFEDPPTVEWNAQKEQELWGMLKNTNTDFEWHALAEHFGVSLVYILQQAAWLYEKELSVLRQRMSRISATLPGEPLPRAARRTGAALEQSPAAASPAAASSRESSGVLERLASPLGAPHASAHASVHAAAADASLSRSSLSRSLSLGDDSDGDSREFASRRRLLSNSRALLLVSDNESELSDSSFDGFLASDRADSDSALGSSAAASDSAVSQSALEAALIEQGGSSSVRSETSTTI